MEAITNGISPVGLKNVLGQTINPATEDTLESIASSVSGAVTIADGNKNVTAAGTAERLVASSTPCVRLIVTARYNNTDMVVVGSSTVVAAVAGRRGIPLTPGQSIELQVSNVTNVYIDSVVSGEGVTFLYLV